MQSLLPKLVILVHKDILKLVRHNSTDFHHSIHEEQKPLLDNNGVLMVGQKEDCDDSN